MTIPRAEAPEEGDVRPLRVLHVPGATGGHPQGLARAERELGVDSRSLVFEASPFGYEADEVVLGLSPSLADRARLEAYRFRVLARALGGAYDVVHYNFGQSLFPRPIVPGSPAVAGFPAPLQHLYRGWSALLGMRDLALLRRRGVALFVTFQGDDVRQADVCRARFAWAPARELEPTAIERGMDRARRTVARRFDRHADGIYYLNPDLAHVLPPRARFVAYAHIDPREWRPEARPANARPLVVHAPTARTIKGTHHLLAALDALRAEGVAFDLELVEGRTQAEARQVYARADLLVDQLLLGWYGGLAVESMALGVPVISHVRASDLGHVPRGFAEELPIIAATPGSIRDVLRTWLGERRAELPEVGRRGRAFVERWHDPRRIGAEVVDDYRAAVARRSREGFGSVVAGAWRG
jgi:glycosyltransferase involved in cell wall biosynthesis